MGQAAGKEVLSPKVMGKLVQEYQKERARCADSAGPNCFDDTEVRWILNEFLPKMLSLNPKLNVTSLSQLRLPKKIAERMQVYSQVFANYPEITSMMWSAMSDPKSPDLTFLEYANFLHSVTRGSFADRIKLVTRILKGGDSNKSTVTKVEIQIIIRAIARYLATVARGVVTVQEVLASKQPAIDVLFAQKQEIAISEFVYVCVEFQPVWRCFDILDVLCGRVERKMEHDLGQPRVFERYIQEGGLGNAKDISGKYPFVPEVIATGIQYLKQHNGLGQQGIFRLAPSSTAQKALLDALDNEMSLHNYLRQLPVEPDTMILVADVMKRYCDKVKDCVLTDMRTKWFCEVARNDRKIPLNEQLEKLLQLFQVLPLPNRQLAGTLISFMYDLWVTQEKELNAGDRLSAESIAVLFSPVLLRIPATVTDPQEAMRLSGDSRAVIKIMLEHHEIFKPMLVDGVRTAPPVKTRRLTRELPPLPPGQVPIPPPRK